MRYYSTLRPIGPGTLPNEDWTHVQNFDQRTFVPAIGREAWGYVDYDTPLTEKEADDYDLVPGKRSNETFQNVERYMADHKFLAADKVKVRRFLREQEATAAVITRKEIRWRDKTGMIGRTGRGNVGLQEEV